MKYHVEKSIQINKSVNDVKSLVEDFNRWSAWSPWTVIEPDHQVTIAGNPGVVGHTMSWEGAIIGSGEMKLVSVEGGSYTYELEFLAPFKSQATTGFVLEERDGGTHVTWTMDSSMPFFLFFMVSAMKAWIGMDYDRGLRMMKEVAEKGSVNATTTNNGVVDVPGFSYVGIKRTVKMGDIGDVMKQDFNKLTEEIVTKRGVSAQHWISLYPKMNMRKMEMTYIAAMSDENLGDDVDLGPEFVRGEVKAGKALEIKHDGSYDFIGNGWSMGMMYTRAKKMKQKGVPYEYYWNSPREVAPEELKTSIYFPLK